MFIYMFIKRFSAFRGKHEKSTNFLILVGNERNEKKLKYQTSLTLKEAFQCSTTVSLFQTTTSFCQDLNRIVTQ